MKRILITGANSYIGTSFEKYLKENYPDQYQVDTVDMIDGSWREKSFAGYDSLVHVAGIVHVKETNVNKELYYKINRDLAVEVAEKAKEAKISQFVFLSTMSVYGMETGVITRETPAMPKNSYADSKLQAENLINQLGDENFKVCILRPPMIYGKGCKGNFQTVISIVDKCPLFPKVRNQRSLIHIDNLSNFIRKVVDEDLSGFYFPQNKEYMNTTQMAKWIAEEMRKRVFISAFAGIGVKCLRPFVGIVKKAFGTLVYKDMEEFNFDYCVLELEESVKKSV